MSKFDIDQVALDTVKTISEIDPDKLKGGTVQAKAQAQCLVIDAMEQAQKASREATDSAPVALLRREIGESSWFDHAPLKPGSPEAEGVRKSAIWDY